ncbi:MAG TPA: VOC family protein, partial [Rhizorhapis sp.]|nr:VOC family protein [Rhizorhapis sp.]
GAGKPANGEPASFANGGTIGFAAPDKDAVDAFHAAGIANGGTCEGEPGLRPQAPGRAYGAYLRDPDGNKICAFCQLPE